MCPPAALALPLMLMGGAAQAYGSLEAGNAKASAYRTQSAEERVKADFIQRQSILDQTASGFEQRKLKDQAQQLQGTQNAMFAQAGVLPDGSVLDVQADTAREASMDQQVLHWNAQVRSQNANFETAQAGRNAAAAERAAKTSIRAGQIGALTAGMGTIAGMISPGRGMDASRATSLGLKW